MDYIKFYNTRASSMGDIASVTDSILIPTEDECESTTESTDSILVPDMKKSRSVNTISEIDKPINKCEILNASIMLNHNSIPVNMRIQIRVLETEKPDYIYHAVKFFNRQIKFVETTPNVNNISANSIVIRGFETLKDSRWTYIRYTENQMRCTLDPRLVNAKLLYFNALTSPFVSVNFNVISSYNGMFKSMPKIKEIIIEKFDMTRVTSMEEMFMDCPKLQRITFINCDMSTVETMAKMCYNCTALRELKFIRCKLNIMCDYWNMLSKCPLTESITAPLEIYRSILSETPELGLKSLIWHSA